MQPSLGHRIKALHAQPDGPRSNLRRVILSNCVSALAVGIAICVAAGWSVTWVAALSPSLFVVLTGGLLFRYTFWIPAVLVASVDGLFCGMLLWYLGGNLHQALRWPAALVGFAIGFGMILRLYAKVSRVAWQATSS
jgi:hypothetical protein